MYTCANCTIHACYQCDTSKMPANCPMRNTQLMDAALQTYHTEEVKDFYLQSCLVEAEGYGQWPRLRETIEFAKKLGYKKLGLGFCFGLRKEAKIVDGILRRHGFEVVSVVCKAGGTAKTQVGITRDQQVRPQKEFEAMCNPIGQALAMNEQKVDFCILLGLCVGHDTLAIRHLEVPVTVLAAKDRVTMHNPLAAIYGAEGYYKKRFFGKKED